MNTYLLGVDIGTSACKVALFDRSGNVVAQKSEEYTVYCPMQGWAEQEPDEWWSTVCSCIKAVLEISGINPAEIAGIGVDGQSWSAIPMDRNGNVLSRTPIWMDTRSADICAEIREKIDENEIFEVCGNSLEPSYTLPKILWFKKNMPHVYQNTYKFLQSNSFIVYRLTGNMTQDISQGYGLHCFDMKKGKWNSRACELLGVEMGQLPDIYACHDVVGHVTHNAAAVTGLCAGMPVVAGGLDAACGTLGAGVIKAGQTQEQGGQAGGMSICTGEYKADKRLILSYHVVPELWLLQGGTTGGGGVMRWLERELGESERAQGLQNGKNSLALLDEKAGAVPAGSDGLIFLPYMAGERSPIWDTHAKGVFFGLDFSKTKGHIIRAALEGVAFSLRHNIETAAAAGVETEILHSMGGAANSKLWTQIKADVTSKSIFVPSSDTATTLGAAILAGVGVGFYQSFDEARDSTFKIVREYTPNEENKHIYDKNYKIYLELYENLKDLMKKSDEGVL